jgi:hypothetical protein
MKLISPEYAAGFFDGEGCISLCYMGRALLPSMRKETRKQYLQRYEHRRQRQSLRLEPKLWAGIDASRGRRGGLVSRNTWITEAILEKLERERGNPR